ncbi:MAG: hypothetical protein ACRC1T_09950 [Clostridium chrysemydis]|uniref:hypothetical protein n=1 Tax=Clostridium chrysemydis TaxID=2665504 RepID=UPI003F2E550F
MNNKEICNKLNEILPNLNIEEKVYKLNRKDSLTERFIILNGVEIRVNSRLNNKSWDREYDYIPHIAFRKDKREKLIEFLGGYHE